jgi:hypothetical protein
MNAHYLEFESDGQRQPWIGNSEFGKQRVMIRVSHWAFDMDVDLGSLTF